VHIVGFQNPIRREVSGCIKDVAPHDDGLIQAPPINIRGQCVPRHILVLNDAVGVIDVAEGRIPQDLSHAPPEGTLVRRVWAMLNWLAFY